MNEGCGEQRRGKEGWNGPWLLTVPFSLTSSEARARGAVERDPKDEPRSGEDKGRVTRGLGVMGERDASCHLLSSPWASLSPISYLS